MNLKVPGAWLAGASLALLLSACAPHAPTRQDGGPLREFMARGYAAEAHADTATSLHNWPLAGQAVALALMSPQRAGAVPLVLYLPGLGEAADAGERWRSAWSAAGYAVLSLQPLAEDAAAWRSSLARSGDFRQLGRERYAAAAVSQRLQVLVDVVDEVRRRGAAGEAPWNRIDATRLALAGFDLGAYTTMAAAGEHVPGAQLGAGRLALRAAIVLSPHASLAAGALDTRWRDIRIPVLSITSDIDTDPLGLVEGAYLRDAPFAHMTGPDKILLSLRGLPHAGLAGGQRASGPARQDADAAATSSPLKSAGSDGTGQRRRGNPQRGSGESGRQGRERGAPAEAGSARQAMALELVQMRTIAVQGVSTAFLDAYLKDDALAREWLSSRAAHWLGAAAELRLK